MEQELVSKAWNMGGAFSVATPGLLMLKEGKASFVTSKGESFNVPLAEIKEVKWPFLQFGFGFHATVNGQKYKFTFMKPNTAPEMDDSELLQFTKFTTLGMGVDSLFTLAHMGRDKQTAKQWRTVLAG